MNTGIDELVAEAAREHESLSRADGIDPDLELAEARLAHGIPAWQVVAARVWHAEHRVQHPRSDWGLARVRWALGSAARATQCPLTAAAVIATCGDVPFRTVLARNTRHRQVLAALATDPDVMVARTAVMNSRSPVDELPLDTRLDVLRAVAAHTRATAAQVEELGRHPNPRVRVPAAGHRRMSTASLARLARDEDRLVRLAVALNRRTPIAALEQLLTDTDDGVRRTTVIHPRLPARVLACLATDRDVEVRRSVLAHKATPVDAIERLAVDPVETIAVTARATLVRRIPGRWVA